MAQRYGGHITLIVSFATWSIASLLTPKSAVNSRATTVARMLVGVAQGFIIPSIHTVLSQVRLLGTISLEGIDQLHMTCALPF
jgi:ACS family sodium-dependent inorganic phosphate cotransporter